VANSWVPPLRPYRLGQGAIGGESQGDGAAASHQHHATAGAAGEKAAQAAGVMWLIIASGAGHGE